MSKQAFDKKIDALELLRSSPASPSTVDQLRRALKDRNNYLVSKGCSLAAELGLQELIPDLLAAFDRFVIDAIKCDPQCWAKNAIVKALKDLGHDDPDVYLRGMRHFQLEPVWGGKQDTAATLRGACALALAACTLDHITILTHLVDVLADPEKPVRIDGVRAMDQLGGSESVLLLRLKTLAGDPEPEVIGQCFSSLLDLSPGDYISFVAGFMEAKDMDVRLEAVAALGGCNESEAVAVLKESWRKQRDPEMLRAIILLLSASREPSALEFLLSMLDDTRVEIGATAIVALAAGRFREEIRERVAAAVLRRDEPKLSAAFEKEFAWR